MGSFMLLANTVTRCCFACLLNPQFSAGGPVTLLSTPGTLTPACEFALREIFDRLDENMDGFLGRSELNELLLSMEGTLLDEAVYQWVIRTFDSREGGVTADGFVDMYVWMLRASGG